MRAFERAEQRKEQLLAQQAILQVESKKRPAEEEPVRDEPPEKTDTLDEVWENARKRAKERRKDTTEEQAAAWADMAVQKARVDIVETSILRAAMTDKEIERKVLIDVALNYTPKVGEVQRKLADAITDDIPKAKRLSLAKRYKELTAVI